MGNISKYFTVDNMSKIRLNGYVFYFCVDYNTVEISDIVNIQKNLMEKNNIKQC